MNMRLLASVSLFVFLLVWLGMSDGKRFLAKKTHERLHKFFPDDDDYLDSWDSLRGFKQFAFAKPLIPYASEFHKTHDLPSQAPDIKPPPQATQPTTSGKEEETKTTISPLPQPTFKPETVTNKDDWSKRESTKVDEAKQVEGFHGMDEGLLTQPKPHSLRGSSHDCDSHYCPVGRVCELDSRGQPICACAGPDHCLRHRHHGARRATGRRVAGREVCGTDGVMYPSHCEMHRMACVLSRHIRASRDEELCVDKEQSSGHGIIDTDQKFRDSLVYNQAKPTDKPSEHRRRTDEDYDDDEDDDEDDDDVKKPRVRYFRTTVVTGSGLEIKCDNDVMREEGAHAVWKRDGILLSDLVNNDIQVFADGSLYFTSVEPYHIGSYICERRSLGVIQAPPTQIHLLSVIAPPQVSVSPVTQLHIPGVTVSVRCHAAGLPDPQISWRLDGRPLSTAGTNPLILDGGHLLQVQNIDSKLNGSNITCVAENSAGASEATSRLFVKSTENVRYQQADSSSEEYYVVFHAEGYTVYEPNYCHIMHVVSGDYFLGKDSHSDATASRLCGDGNRRPGNTSCVWGQAVHVGARYVYVAQPTLKRVLVIELTDRFNPIEVIDLTCAPQELTYLEHTDQIWVTCGEDSAEDSRYAPRTTVSHMTSVIRQSSVSIRHQTVHIQPLSGITDDFSMVHRMFLPHSHTDGIKVTLSYGYATLGHRDHALYKVDLTQLKFVKHIETPCAPVSVALLPIGGKIIVSCEANSEVQSFTLDYVTDAIVDGTKGAGAGLKWRAEELSGKLYVSPDSRQLSVVNGKKLSAYYVMDDGELTLLNTFKLDDLHVHEIRDLVYSYSYSPKHVTSYNLYLRDSSQRVFFLDLSYNQVSTISGIDQLLLDQQSSLNTGPNASNIVSRDTGSDISRDIGSVVSRDIGSVVSRDMMTCAGPFSSHVVAAVDSSIVVIDSQRHVTQCQWPGLTPVSTLVGVRKE